MTAGQFADVWYVMVARPTHLCAVMCELTRVDFVHAVDNMINDLPQAKNMSPSSVRQYKHLSLNSTEAVFLVISLRGCYAENGPVEFKLCKLNKLSASAEGPLDALGMQIASCQLLHKIRTLRFKGL